MYSRRDVIAVECCAFCWFVLSFNYENARSKNRKKKNSSLFHFDAVTRVNGIYNQLIPAIPSVHSSARMLCMCPKSEWSFWTL